MTLVHDKPKPLRRLLWVLLLLLLPAVMWLGAQTIQGRADGQSIQLLGNSLRRAAVHCYAVEGRYPPDLDYLCATYGVGYDKERFAVYYTTVASNLMPDITVLELGEGVVA